MAYRIREAMREPSGAAPLGGAGKFVEVDETYIGRMKGFRKSRGPGHKMKVLSLVERGGSVRSIKVESVSRPTVEAIVAKNVARESRLLTDEAPYYPAIGTRFASHESVNLSKAGGDPSWPAKPTLPSHLWPNEKERGARYGAELGTANAMLARTENYRIFTRRACMSKSSPVLGKHSSARSSAS